MELLLCVNFRTLVIVISLVYIRIFTQWHKYVMLPEFNA